MAEELGKIEKPTVEQFKKERKLFFVPLIFSLPETERDFAEIIGRYWDDVDTQIDNLEAKLGNVSKIFHEMVPEGGEPGSKVIQELNSAGYKVVQSRLEKGAVVQPIEDIDLFTEFMDWNRCMSIGLQNRKVIAKVYESYSEVLARRNDDIVKKLNESLKEKEIGILIMREGHHVQFPSDIDVFYISPPSLDELKRWLRKREEELQAEFARVSKEPEEPKKPEKAAETAEPVKSEEPVKSKKPRKPKKPRK